MIELKNIYKTYKVSSRNAGIVQVARSFFHKQASIEALKDMSFSIQRGEIVGYIGPNGAGKSTTIKIMSGILLPDKGSCTIDGYIPWKDRKTYVRNIGVVFGQRSQLWWDVPVIDSFALLRNIYDINRKMYQHNLEELTARLQLSKILKTPTRSLSLGQRMRCEFAASLLHSPGVLFLDEPTIGLDSASKVAIRNFVLELNRDKKVTVVLTSHDIQNIELLAQRVLFVGKGKLLFDGSFQDLKKYSSSRKVLTLKYSGRTPVLDSTMTCIKHEDDLISVSIDPQYASVQSAISSFISQGESCIHDISIDDLSSDEVMVDLYKEFNL